MPIFIRKNVEGRTDEEEASFQNFFLHLIHQNHEQQEEFLERTQNLDRDLRA
jgi:hypothetical protein